MPDEDRRPPARRAAHRVVPRRRRVPLLVGVLGALVLLAGLGAAGPAAPVTAPVALPPPDTTLTGATGRLPDAGVAPLPGLPDAGPPDAAPLPDAVDGSTLGIPQTVLDAYRAAATTMQRDAPDCRLTWPLVAGIGKIESGHASGGAVDATGTTRRPILGPELTGTGGNAEIRDSDGGALDHDATWDRAVGPTQFIPSSWRVYGADGNGDGRADPDNVFDAALATARYLCSGGGDLAQASARHDAVFRYNHSEDYVATVLRWADAYASGALPVPDSPGPGGTGDGGSAVPSGDGPPVTLAALPSSSVPTAGAPAGVALPAAARAPSAPRPGPAVSVAVVPPPASGSAPSPTPLSASTTPTTGTAAAAAPHPALAPSSTTPSSTTPSSTTPSSGTASSSTATSTTGSSTPRPAVHPAPAATAPPASTTTSSTTTPPSSTTTSSSTTTPSSAAPVVPCATLVAPVAQASGIPAGQLTAVSTAGPGAGRTTCTVRGPQGPILVAVTGTPTPPTPATGVSRTLSGGRTVLTIPTTSGLTPDRAKAVLAAVATASP